MGSTVIMADPTVNHVTLLLSVTSVMDVTGEIMSSSVMGLIMLDDFLMAAT